MKKEASLYLKKAEKQGIIPNFYLSEPYLRLSKSKGVLKNGWVWIESEGWILFPPICLDIKDWNKYPKLPMNIWSDFCNYPVRNACKSEFLDWEYLFVAGDFNNMEGGKWETFRKNIRK